MFLPQAHLPSYHARQPRPYHWKAEGEPNSFDGTVGCRRQPYLIPIAAKEEYGGHPVEIVNHQVEELPSSSRLHSDLLNRDAHGWLDSMDNMHKFTAREAPEEVIETMEFKAATEKLYTVLVKAEKLLDLFFRSFQQEMSALYMDRVAAWRLKVILYNKDLVLPNVKHEEAMQSVGKHHFMCLICEFC